MVPSNSNDPLIEELRRALPPAYELGDFLDSGGQGAVFTGRFNGEPVAIKLFNPQRDPGFLRLERELDLFKKIKCPHLVRVLDHTAVTSPKISTQVVAYEFLSGGDLTRFLPEDSPKFSTEQVIRLGLQTSTAISELWAQRIVHRDIKPANIVIRESGDFVVIDVGLARHLDRSNLTIVGGAPGTLGFMSPEQAMGRRSLTFKSDIFSLGITLFFLATKIHPFGASQENILLPQFTPPRLWELRPDLPVPVAKLIQSMIEPVAARRPANTQDTFSRFTEDLGE